MTDICPVCSDTCLPTDDLDCDRASVVCPTCAPDFVLANVTTFTDVKDPLLPPDEA
jgi:hypothetical protein